MGSILKAKIITIVLIKDGGKYRTNYTNRRMNNEIWENIFPRMFG